MERMTLWPSAAKAKVYARKFSKQMQGLMSRSVGLRVCMAQWECNGDLNAALLELGCAISQLPGSTIIPSLSVPRSSKSVLILLLVPFDTAPWLDIAPWLCLYSP